MSLPPAFTGQSGVGSPAGNNSVLEAYQAARNRLATMGMGGHQLTPPPGPHSAPASQQPTNPLMQAQRPPVAPPPQAGGMPPPPTGPVRPPGPGPMPGPMAGAGAMPVGGGMPMGGMPPMGIPETPSQSLDKALPAFAGMGRSGAATGGTVNSTPNQFTLMSAQPQPSAPQPAPTGMGPGMMGSPTATDPMAANPLAKYPMAGNPMNPLAGQHAGMRMPMAPHAASGGAIERHGYEGDGFVRPYIDPSDYDPAYKRDLSGVGISFPDESFATSNDKGLPSVMNSSNALLNATPIPDTSAEMPAQDQWTEKEYHPQAAARPYEATDATKTSGWLAENSDVAPPKAGYGRPDYNTNMPTPNGNGALGPWIQRSRFDPERNNMLAALGIMGGLFSHIGERDAHGLPISGLAQFGKGASDAAQWVTQQQTQNLNTQRAGFEGQRLYQDALAQAGLARDPTTGKIGPNLQAMIARGVVPTGDGQTAQTISAQKLPLELDVMRANTISGKIAALGLEGMIKAYTTQSQNLAMARMLKSDDPVFMDKISKAEEANQHLYAQIAAMVQEAAVHGKNAVSGVVAPPSQQIGQPSSIAVRTPDGREFTGATQDEAKAKARAYWQSRKIQAPQPVTPSVPGTFVTGGDNG